METKLTEKAIANLRDLAKLAEKIDDDRVALYAAGQTDGMREALKLMTEQKTA